VLGFFIVISYTRRLQQRELAQRVYQMNFMQKFFGDNGSELSERLQDSGFTAEQAGRFLSEAASGILNAYKHKELELIISALETEKPAKLLSTVNVNAIANNIGMSSEQVTAGFEVLAPVMSKEFVKYSGGIVGAAASIAWGSTSNFHNLVK
jgi:hypothetical protein